MFSKHFLLSFLCLSLWNPLGAQNLLSNGDFESGGAGWSNMVGGGGAGTFTCPITGIGNIHAGSNALRSTITTIGTNAWDIQTVQSGFVATIGAAHTLTFWAKASVAGRQLRIVFQNTSYTAQDYTLTANWMPYTLIFTPSEASLQLKIHYFQTGDFYLDDFSIPDISGGPILITSTLTPTTKFQQMVGFGGALTWYADRIISSPNKNAICDLLFTDSGLDIVRLKNWYYPLNYPTNKSTTTMDPAGNKTGFDITNQLHALAKARNTNIEVLLCSFKNKPYLHGYAYHLYNYAGGAGSISPTNINIIRDEFNNRPNFMTEFSTDTYNWIDVARMVHINLTEANTSAYLYWELAWDNASSSAMIGLDNSGGYTIKDNYYSIKHFSKYIDKGYTRIAASGSNATLNVSAFLNPAGNQITMVVINNHASSQPFNVLLENISILSAQAYQSFANNYWQNLGAVSLSTTQLLVGKSITTYIINSKIVHN